MGSQEQRSDMNSGVNARLLFERRYLIKAVIVKLLENLTGTDIANIDDQIKTIKRLTEKAVVEKQILTHLEFIFYDDTDEPVSALIFKVDWHRYQIHLGDGDNFIELEPRRLIKQKALDEFEITLKSISETLHEIGEVMYGAAHYLRWRRCKHFVIFLPGADPEATAQLGYSSVEPKEIETNLKFFRQLIEHRDILEVSTTPAKLDELRVRFISKIES